MKTNLAILLILAATISSNNLDFLFLEENNNELGLDVLKSYSKQELLKYAQAAEFLINESFISDVNNFLFDKSEGQLIAFIKKIASQVKASIYKLSEIVEKNFSISRYDYLRKHFLSTRTLIKYAYAAEMLDRERRNASNLYDGFDGYIRTLERDGLISFIAEKLSVHPETVTQELFETLCVIYQLNEKDEPIPVDINHELVHASRHELEDWAFACEAYDRIKRGENPTQFYGLRNIINHESDDYLKLYISDIHDVYRDFDLKTLDGKLDRMLSKQNLMMFI
jgi:hypothetical protein